MPKLKTHKASKKRFKITGSGKVKRTHAYKNHILTKKTTKRKRNLRKGAMASDANVATIKQLLPYA
ncbi:MAG TPA: 50S ribosomal protein L35 [Thermoclostridium caenicola]|uniref:Large ribosomal subunit protein bL35 n=1 Tax=Thermoclostridium caenicola TaxID=659425 RepID=A0A1M6JG45_9FIRM|nr:50S ribosomal protein L35 [Thermoclostridium caenicola]SHJ45673.1 LSU ribosomal protein L35P [Thermoclostridium caenicola]HOK44115.1 50S ribosomal protein L35 [Thermoclostridium caenicola]HPU21618.1 50S ribosomal protein L35 [Thermoclostridium caenicola]